jgi:formylglycine-generating enzyme required for sulfatase activity
MLSQAQSGDEAAWRAYADWLQEQEDGACQQLGAAIARQVQGPLGLRFAPLPAGTFWMGGGGGKPRDRQVTIEAPFALGIYPVTQGQWRAVMGNNPSDFSKGGGWSDKVSGISDADLDLFPVEQVSWEDVQEFLQKLNEKEHESRRSYRLPTEAEWEYACRGGALSKADCSYHFYFQQPTNDLSSHQANCDGGYPFGSAKKGPDLDRTCKVGSYLPNRLGIYDMHGNVWEWTADLHSHYEGGSARVIRGGGWKGNAEFCRAANRFGYPAGDRDDELGFRLVQVPSGL